MQKKDYFDEIIAYDDRVQKYIVHSHAKLLMEHLTTIDMMNEIKHKGYIWNETK